MDRGMIGARDRIDTLIDYRARLVEYLHAKAKAEDWHGVADAANDLREVEAEIAGMRWCELQSSEAAQ